MEATSERNIIDRLSQGDEHAFKKVYSLYKKEARNWLMKHFGDDNLFEDVYQDAVIVLYEAALDGKLADLKCTLKTYLFAVCRNQLLKRFKLQKRQDDKVDEVQIYYREWVEEEEGENELTQQLKEHFTAMKEPCKSILKLFYYQSMSLQQIAVTLGYSDKNVLKVQKSRCVRYLKEKVWKK
ncbi:RNA polymerase sigma factor [Ekhidna sp. To15]|uniref:RNA polymerase sigma factor n=1 Tax=Ekhidna sp. To15 TaxID=3395267 RepID=UPI003F5214A9